MNFSRQESTRKVGFTITQQEEVIRGQLENLQVLATVLWCIGEKLTKPPGTLQYITDNQEKFRSF